MSPPDDLDRPPYDATSDFERDADGNFHTDELIPIIDEVERADYLEEFLSEERAEHKRVGPAEVVTKWPNRVVGHAQLSKWARYGMRVVEIEIGVDALPSLRIAPAGFGDSPIRCPPVPTLTLPERYTGLQSAFSDDPAFVAESRADKEVCIVQWFDAVLPSQVLSRAWSCGFRAGAIAQAGTGELRLALVDVYSEDGYVDR